MKNRSRTALPIPVRKALLQMGSQIRDARRRRRIPTAVMAERAFICRTTLNKLERGDPNVAMGTYATVLFALGLIDRLTEVADPSRDRVGLSLDEERLPQRIRMRRSPPSQG